MVGPVFSVVQIATTEAYRQVSGKLQENGINVQSIVNGDALKNIMNTSPPASPPRKNTTTSGGSSSGISASPSKTSSESIELTERKTRKFE